MTYFQKSVKSLATLGFLISLVFLGLHLCMPTLAFPQTGQSEIKGVVPPPAHNAANGTTAEAIQQNVNATSHEDMMLAAPANATSIGEELNKITQEEADPFFTPNQEEAAAFSWSNYFFVVGGLFLLLAFLWLIVWTLRKRGALPGGNMFGRNSFKIEASLPLGPKKALILVRFLNSRFLLGVTDHQISLVKELEVNEGQAKTNKEQLTDFAAAMQQASQKFDGSQHEQ